MSEPTTKHVLVETIGDSFGSDSPRWVRQTIVVLNVILFGAYWLGLTAAVCIVYIYPRPKHSALAALLNGHFGALVGLPAAAIMAFSVVLALRVTEGNIQLDIGWLKLRGAAGPILLWNVTFAIVAAAVLALW